MKRLFFSITLSLLYLIVNSATITIEKARLTAYNFVFGHKKGIKSTMVYSQHNEGKIYIINFEPEGWALVSSDDNARPIIGYSLKGYFQTDDLNSNISSWLNNQLLQIEHPDKTKNWKNEWKSLEEGQLIVEKVASTVDPLLKTTWDQGRGWNDLCPAYAAGPNGKAYIGCVAVAMAQALHNISYPDRPVGSKTYALEPYGSIYTNFDKEAPYEWSKMSLTKGDNYNRQLLYNCAVAVEMDFGGSGSGAYTPRVPFAFKRYFQFDDAVKCIDRKDYSTEKEWTDILKAELIKGNVLIYSGNPEVGGAGHAFNIDGFAASGYFHFNWGWSGSYNGYFSINNVAPGSSNYNANQQAVIGISRPYTGPTDISLSNTTISKDAEINTQIGVLSVEDISENETFEFEVLEKDFLSLKKSKNFAVENLQLKTINTLSSSSYAITIRVTDSEDLTFEKSFSISVSTNASIKDVPNHQYLLYPNPAHSVLHITNYKTIQSIQIVDLSGKIRFNNQTVISNDIDISSLNQGVYFINLVDKNGNQSIERLLIE